MFTLTGFADELCPDFEEQMKIWKEMGFKWFELRSAWGVNVLKLSNQQASDIKKISSEYGMRVSCIGSPIGKTYLEDDFSVEMQRLERAVYLAKFFDCSRVRVFSFYSRVGSILDRREEVMTRLKAMADYAASNGIELLHENEMNIYGTHSEQSADIASTLKSKYFGLVFDPANYSIAGEDSLESEAIMHNYITYMHCKDYSGHGMDMSIPGTGVSHIPQVFERLRDLEIFISVEPHLDHAGQFGGFTSPDKYRAAVKAIKEILNSLKIEWC